MSTSMSKAERARAYAARIVSAIRKDQIAVAAGLIKSAADMYKSNLASEFKSIGAEIDGLVFTGTKAAITTSYKDELIAQIAENLGVKRPEIVGVAFTKGASVQNFLAILQEMQGILEDEK
jgi:hypothetical protein